ANGSGKVTIKKYANRRLYDTESSAYITLDRLAQMVREGRDFEVVDAKTGEDITRQVLTQIIVEEEAHGGTTMLPINFLKQLIGHRSISDNCRGRGDCGVAASTRRGIRHSPVPNRRHRGRPDE